MKAILGEWEVQLIVDTDGHLNAYVKHSDGSEISEIESGEGDGINGEALAVRFTTASIEKNPTETA
jgi:hypothetical protein